jgi:hypothetical protein
LRGCFILGQNPKVSLATMLLLSKIQTAMNCLV